MGNFLLCLEKTTKNPSRRLEKNRNIKFKKITIEKTGDSENNVSVQKESSTFNWSSMQNMLLEFNTNFYSKKITRQDIIAADKMLLYIDQDIAYHCKTLLDRLISTKRSYIFEFEQHSNYAKIIPENNENPSKCLMHNFHMIHLHKKILNALQFEGNPFEILDLLALSHAVMKVTTSDFKLLNIVFCKYLSTLELESEITVRPLVQYLNVITNYLCNAVEKCMKHENLVEEITSQTQLQVSNARKNYRQLKKWHEMVDLVKTECSNLHKECMLNISTNRKSSEEILISAIDY